MDNQKSDSCSSCICTNCEQKDTCVYRFCNIEDVGLLYCKGVRTVCKLKSGDEKHS